MRSAFSLVELSIVLVILGLLTGGILAGQNLIRAAELRSLTTQFTQFHTATMTFRDKYFALPGDMQNATDFWGIAAGTTGNDSTCKAAAGTGSATCNGNGDGIIRASIVANDEIFRAWEHLVNAGFIEGTYTGINAGPDDAAPIYVAGGNVPATKAGNGRISVLGESTVYTATADFFEIPIGNRLSARNAGSGLAGILTPEESWNIDTKIDDGKPTTGNFRIFHKKTGAFAPECVDSDDPAVAEYQLMDTGKRCAPDYLL